MQYAEVRGWNKGIKHERLAHGWSQSEAAKQLGIDARTYRGWEKGQHFPGYPGRRALSKLYNKSIEELGLLSPVEI